MRIIDIKVFMFVSGFLEFLIATFFLWPEFCFDTDVFTRRWSGG